MKITLTGFLICLVSLFFMIASEGTGSAGGYAFGFFMFPIGTVISIVGLVRKWD